MIEEIKTLYADLPETTPYLALKVLKNQMVKGWGGDPKDPRQRIDALRAGTKRYWEDN